MRLLQASDVRAESKSIDWQALAFCEPKPAAMRSELRHDDVLLTVRTTAPRAVHIEHPPEGVVAGSPFAILRPRVGQIDPAYLCWVLNSPAVNQRLRACFRGSAMPFLSPKDLAQFEIPVPSMGRQNLLTRADGLRQRVMQLAQRMDAATVQLLEAMASPISSSSRKTS
ncbi:MAG: hypothetical protein KAI24_26640 [Planctomycetes bacterium]|nr:hypothetical protein [Planctomycetota bacterium]